jgi:hypothetical protein
MQVILNTLTDHDFQDAFKNGRSAGNGAHAGKGTTWRATVASKSKVRVGPDGSTLWDKSHMALHPRR